MVAVVVVASMPTAALPVPADTHRGAPPGRVSPSVVAAWDAYNPLAGLKALPKPHHSWPLPADVVNASLPIYMDFVRVTQSAPIALHCTQQQVAASVAAAKAAGPDATIALNFSPWSDQVDWPAGTPPTTTGTLEDTAMQIYTGALANISNWIAEANAADAIPGAVAVTVGVALIDSETFRVNGSQPVTSEWNAAITRKHDLVYNATVAAFPGVVVEWYARGHVWRASTDSGWTDNSRRLFTLQERGSTFGTSLYAIPYMGYTREAYNRTYNAAVAAGVKETTPWLALGCGYHVEFGAAVWSFEWDYDRMTSWQLGAEINNAWFGERPARFAAWNGAQRVAMYPSIFDPRSAVVTTPHGPSTAMIEHFVAYVNGAAMLKELPESTRNCTSTLW